ncbi:MAG: histidine kinase [Ignavibacteriaceae bacterium]|nr:histidine kinase [Ignavibacteriaceae bacterium]
MQDNPFIKNVKNYSIYLLVLGFSFAVISFSILYFGLKINLNTSFVESMVSTIVLMGFTLTLYYPTKYISIEKSSLLKVLISHEVTIIISSILWIVVVYIFMIGVIGFGDDYESFFFNTILWRFLVGIMFYALITSYYYLVTYYTGFQERKLKESELKGLVTEAELKSLKFQINPHFIFNSLNSISALTEIDPGKAKNMILKLADFLRYILATNEREKNKLSEELKNIRLYLDIEKVRFEDKFEFKEKIEPECEKVEIPNMILQPLFENVIKHAVYETLDKVILTLRCSRQNEFLKISIENDFDESSTSQKGTGVGLKNIYERLKLIYHQDNLMDVKKEKGKFSVTLYIPKAKED